MTSFGRLASGHGDSATNESEKSTQIEKILVRVETKPPQSIPVCDSGSRRFMVFMRMLACSIPYVFVHLYTSVGMVRLVFFGQQYCMLHFACSFRSTSSHSPHNHDITRSCGILNIFTVFTSIVAQGAYVHFSSPFHCYTHIGWITINRLTFSVVLLPAQRLRERYKTIVRTKQDCRGLVAVNAAAKQA